MSFGLTQPLPSLVLLGFKFAHHLFALDDGGLELALPGAGAGRNGHRRQAVRMPGERHPVEQRRLPVAGLRDDVAFDGGRCAVYDLAGEGLPTLAFVRRDPRGELKPERLSMGRYAQQQQGRVVGRKHHPIRAHAHEAAGLAVQQVPQVDDLHRRIQFFVDHRASPPGPPDETDGPLPP